MSSADLRTVRTGSFSSIMNTAGVYGIAILFLALGALLQATGAIGNFLSPQNMLNIVDAVALVGIVAVGMSFVTYSGNYADLSVPTTMGFTGYICIELLRYGFGVAIIGSLAVGLLIGLLNGFVVGKFKANPIIWTLAVNYVTMGVIRLVLHRVATEQFEGYRKETAAVRAIIHANDSLRDRDARKRDDLVRAARTAFIERGESPLGATVVAELGILVFQVALDEWAIDEESRSMTHVIDTVMTLVAGVS